MSTAGQYEGARHSHDLDIVERSRFLQEYSSTRPSSAGNKPRSLIQRVGRGGIQADDDAEPEPEPGPSWVLEGWGDEPSVPEVARQSSRKMSKYSKDVPAPLPNAGNRRVLSAGGNQRQQPTKPAGERRRPPPGAPSVARAKPQAAACGAPRPVKGLTARQLQQLDVGDESDYDSTQAPLPPQHHQHLPPPPNNQTQQQQQQASPHGPFPLPSADASMLQAYLNSPVRPRATPGTSVVSSSNQADTGPGGKPGSGSGSASSSTQAGGISASAAAAAREQLQARLAEDLELLTARRQSLMQQQAAAWGGTGGVEVGGGRIPLGTLQPSAGSAYRVLTVTQGPPEGGPPMQPLASPLLPRAAGPLGVGLTGSPKRPPAAATRRQPDKDPWSDPRLTGWEDDGSSALDVAALCPRSPAVGSGPGLGAVPRTSSGAQDLPPRAPGGAAGHRAYATQPSHHAALALVPSPLAASPVGGTSGARQGHGSSGSPAPHAGPGGNGYAQPALEIANRISQRVTTNRAQAQGSSSPQLPAPRPGRGLGSVGQDGGTASSGAGAPGPGALRGGGLDALDSMLGRSNSVGAAARAAGAGAVVGQVLRKQSSGSSGVEDMGLSGRRLSGVVLDGSPVGSSRRVPA